MRCATRWSRPDPFHSVDVKDWTDVRIPGTNLDLSRLCLGGSVFGWTADTAQSEALLDRFVADGGNLVSTAANYTEWAEGNVGGESETIIGGWIAARRRRDAIVICAKQGLPFGTEAGGFSAKDLTRRTELALRRLRTDYIDIVCLQCLPTQEPTEESFTAFEKLVADGKVRCFGSSNMSADQLRRAGALAKALGAPPIRVLENHYSLLTRSKFEGELADACAADGVLSLPYWGLEKGFLTGKYTSGRPVDSPRVRRYNPYSYVNERSLRVLTTLREVAADTGTSSATVALLWLRSRPLVASVLASARNLQQYTDLAPVLTMELSDEQLAALTAASAGEDQPLPGAVG